MQRTVTRIIDGDTFEVKTKIGDTRFIKLAGVNAPELGERGGVAAMNRLKKLISGKTVTIVPVGRIQ
jgi:endonuclease YncB( thermonuclease family)